MKQTIQTYLKPLVTLSGIVLLALGIVRLQVEHWLHTTPAFLEQLMPTDCHVLSICGMAYVHYFGNAVRFMAAGMVLLIVGLAGSASPVRRLNPASWFRLKLSDSQWKVAFLVNLFVAVILAAVQMVRAADTGSPPTVRAWLLPLVLAGVACACYDRAPGHQAVLTWQETLTWGGHTLFLLLLGFVFMIMSPDSLIGRVIVVDSGLLILFELWRHGRISKQVALLFGITLIGMALYTFRMLAWQYAFIGDEYAFFDLAKSLLNRPDLPSPLEAAGVYGVHPVFSSYLHAFSMKLFGADVYGWRISEIFMVFLAVPPLYTLVRTISTGRAALVAVVVYTSSHHLLGLSKVGYNNLQALPVVVAALAFMIRGITRQSLLGIFLSGVAAAAAFYVFYAALPLIILPVLLLGLVYAFSALRSKPAPLNWLRLGILGLFPFAIFMLAVLLMCYPRLVNLEWVDLLSNESVVNSRVEHVTDPWTEQIRPNIWYTLMANVYLTRKSHYVLGPHLDPVSALLMMAGMGYLISRSWRDSVALFLVLGYAVSCFFIGGLAPYGYPVNTRTFLLVPFYAVIAAIGTEWLIARLDHIRLTLVRRTISVSTLCLPVIAAAILGLNLYQFFEISETESERTEMALLVKEFQQADPDTVFYYVPQHPFNETVLMVLSAYEYDTNRLRVVDNYTAKTAVTHILSEAQPPYHVLVSSKRSLLQAWLTVFHSAWPDYPVDALRDPEGPRLYRISVDTEDAPTPSPGALGDY
ncbi:MAG: glycosyltransferase family 39 protein [Anaerolineae bacterium]|nr:glycosyltransferase family 39 protein [Anaerolineae bacterium]